MAYLNKQGMNARAAYQSEGVIFGRLKIVPERVFFCYQLSVINNHDENVITSNVILLSSLLRNESRIRDESSNGAARCAAPAFGKNILRLRRNGNGTKRNEALRNVAECSEVERRSKLFFPLLEH
ncbi:MAG: hypothetical protein ACYC49_12595 [Ignavibacteriaceae bacterium]